MTKKELQEILYNILYEIDIVCSKENIPYTLYGGTMLGAVRHGGFIPWDDDIDICVWRSDYPAMFNALKQNLPSYFQITEPKDIAPNFYDFVIRVQDTRYHWHEPIEEDLFYDNKQNYLCVDIFVLGDSADSLIGHKINSLRLKMIYGLAMGHRYSLDFKKYTSLQKAQVFLLSEIGKHISMEKILQYYNNVCAQMSKKKKKYCIKQNGLPTKNLSLPYESAWYNEIILMEFEGHQFPLHKNYHKQLTIKYGDYMTPHRDSQKYIVHFKE